jgi:hypothetical protein
MNCPRCKKELKGFPAISRRDNKTEICSECGTDEALFDAGYNATLLICEKSDLNDLENDKDFEQEWLWRLEE